MESLNQALVECVKAAGGSANVGPKLWPEKPREAAQRLLLDCLNEDRNAKLSPEQVLLVLKLARDKGYHAGLGFILRALGYGPTTPIEPKDELAELQRQFIEASSQMAATAQRMEHLAQKVASAQAPLRAVA
jgi:hypothetical protein